MSTSSLKYVVATLMYICFLGERIEGSASFSLSSSVIPSETRRQGLNQDTPCLSDDVLYICTRNETSPGPARFYVNGANVVYDFAIPGDIGSDQGLQDSKDGLVGRLVNATLLTLMVDLATSTEVVNGSIVGCGEGSDTQIDMVLSVIGTASEPSVSVRSMGLTKLIVDMRIPNTSAICVDRYNATIQVGDTTNFAVKDVTDPGQEMYSFEFPVNLCRNMLTNATAVAITDNVEGIVSAPAMMITNDTDTTTIFTSPVTVIQQFSSSGLIFTITWQVIDPAITIAFSVTCHSETSVLNCWKTGVDTLNQMNVLVPYSSNVAGQAITFNVSYLDAMCMDARQATVNVSNINTSTEVSPPNRAVEVSFNTSLFDRRSVMVEFSSNCTESTSVNYPETESTVTIPIPKALSTVNSGRCRYTIQLVNSNGQQIGYPVVGYFGLEGLPPPPVSFPIGAVVGGVLGGLAVILIVIIVLVLGCFFRSKCSKGVKQLPDEEDFQLEHTNSSSIKHEKAPDGEEYALVTTKGAKPADSVYQDPSTIQHEEAPGGELYAVTDKPKKTSKKAEEKSEDQLAALYSVPDKTKKAKQQGVTYASVDVGPTNSDKRLNMPPQTEYSTVVY